ncbi:MAG: hypothetical protein Q4A08_03530 [Bacteroidales bacterium]|nr:hypothetical protein [Bacteroidales bacterium]
MAVAINTHEQQSISSLDALWVLIQGQKKSVQRALAKRLNAFIKAEEKAKVKMTEKEFYAKLDESIASAKAGNTIAMKDGETTDQFIDRLLCTK